MRKLAFLQTLESALSRVLLASDISDPGSGTETPLQRVFRGDTLYQVAKFTNLHGDNRLARTNKHGSLVVRQKHQLMKLLTDYLSDFNDDNITVLRSPVKTNTITFVIFSQVGLGYVNIFETGAMVTMMRQNQEETVQGNRDCFTSVSVQGVSEKIEDPDILTDYIRREDEFWNAQSPYRVDLGGEKPELMMVLQDHQSTLLDATEGPFPDYLTPGQTRAVKMQRSMMNDWLFELDRDYYSVIGIVHKNTDSTVTVWGETKYNRNLDPACLDPYFQSNPCTWNLYFMQNGIGSSDELDRYITGTDWINPANALFVCTQNGRIYNWVRHIQAVSPQEQDENGEAIGSSDSDSGSSERDENNG